MSIFPAPTTIRPTRIDALLDAALTAHDGRAGSGASFGPTLKCLRQQAGLKQVQLADAAEVDHSYVSRLESGTRMPTRDAVNRLADALRIDTSERGILLIAAGFAPQGAVFGTVDPIAARAAALIEWTGPWFAVLTMLADLAKEKGITRDQVHFAVDFVLDDDMPSEERETNPAIESFQDRNLPPTSDESPAPAIPTPRNGPGAIMRAVEVVHGA